MERKKERERDKEIYIYGGSLGFSLYFLSSLPLSFSSLVKSYGLLIKVANGLSLIFLYMFPFLSLFLYKMYIHIYIYNAFNPTHSNNPIFLSGSTGYSD